MIWSWAGRPVMMVMMMMVVAGVDYASMDGIWTCVNRKEEMAMCLGLNIFGPLLLHSRH
jgi:hypothetical protein